MAAEASWIAWFELGRRAWPTVQLAQQDFFAWVEERDGSAESAPDLYLACACAHGDPAALRAFEASYGREVRLALARMKQPESALEEVEQIVREKLFVGDGTRAPRIADFAGRGDLRGWLRVVAVREAVSWLRRGDRAVLADDALPDVAAPSDPELAHMRSLYANEFRAALERAFAALGTRERNLLRQHFLDGLGVERLAALYRVHTATAARWLVRARENLVAGTRREMVRALRVRTDEVSGIMELIRSQLEVSLTGLLRKTGSGA